MNEMKETQVEEKKSPVLVNGAVDDFEQEMAVTVVCLDKVA